jgi:hypothetical protein
MGWTGLYTKPASVTGYFKERWEQDDDLKKITCLGQAFVGRSTLYGVWEVHLKDSGKTYQFATVTLCTYKSGDCAFYYKDMDETVGPCESRCPLSLLKLLKTPAPSEFARRWRKDCWENALGLSADAMRIKWNRLVRRANSWPRIPKDVDRFYAYKKIYEQFKAGEISPSQFYRANKAI